MLNDLFGLTGKVAIVTGGNGGIGLGIARGLAGAGARVVIAGRNADKLAAAVEELKTISPGAISLVVDVTDEKSVATMVDQAVQRCGQLDILVNNAGGTVRKLPQELSLAEWQQVIDVNVTSTFLCARSAYPHMKRAGGGKIINLGSMLSTFGAPYAAAYCAGKAGVVQLTKSLATAWAADNIQVNAILPGWIETDLTQGAREQVPGLNERVLARTPAGRWGRTGDLAGIAVFLAGRGSDFVTGTAIPIDGGYSTLI
jgi:2-dehydro-3-deoxy-D-gluconate 5-dehydrogenase